MGRDRVFCECFDDKHEWCTDPDMVIRALDDAREALNYSNWACGKFDIAEIVIRKYCKEHKIPLRFQRQVEEEK
ncbi:MAG: hypothetical protein GY931_10565 [Maribacter sp.]|nr:hypothetical protein [Maribacter sp.]